ncbi:type 1 fimbrial protein [Xenorhabdus sp. Reich]|uniref:Type 1 fimbrial protein n=1 Tax=Xenorhabdus littoralis TaxID=2582835 RepID=A0ABU4SLU7_9GAMM|nr:MULTISPECIES: type 1 fimbrial protein [unclassified Xenorhabdus]MDX7992581.1 type 1 fimbrial protein [Xenorhabdus sp. psl]MDX7999590.1 type 1 fimbrial protein [Xenorhabdus sp. Reich]
MKNCLKYFISCLLVSWLSYGYAESQGGIIRFSGAIVDPGCQVVVTNAQAKISCYRLGKNLTVKQNILTHKTTGNVMLPGNIGVSSVKWTDNQKRVAIINVDYF